MRTILRKPLIDSFYRVLSFSFSFSPLWVHHSITCRCTLKSLLTATIFCPLSADVLRNVCCDSWGLSKILRLRLSFFVLKVQFLAKKSCYRSKGHVERIWTTDQISAVTLSSVQTACFSWHGLSTTQRAIVSIFRLVSAEAFSSTLSLFYEMPFERCDEREDPEVVAEREYEKLSNSSTGSGRSMNCNNKETTPTSTPSTPGLFFLRKKTFFLAATFPNPVTAFWTNNYILYAILIWSKPNAELKVEV